MKKLIYFLATISVLTLSFKNSSDNVTDAITIEVPDESGYLLPGAAIPVTFSMEGPGKHGTITLNANSEGLETAGK